MDASELRRDVALVDCLTGTAWLVAATGESDAASLARVGLVAGTRVEIESRAPFGGPLVVRVGRSRVAIPRAIGRGIRVTALR